MAYKRKIDRRFWDPAIYRFGDFKRLRRSSLSDPERIERLRWRFLLRFQEKIRPGMTAAWDEVKRLGEAFIPGNNPNEPLRIDYHEDYSGQGGVTMDSRFWEREPSKLVGGGPVRDLAEIGDLKEWEEIVLPEKQSRVTEEKLAAGIAYDAIDIAWRYRGGRLQKLNQLLYVSVRELDLLPQGRPHRQDPAIVRLNGRDYPFELRYHYSEPLYEKWPEPGEEIPVITIPRFQIDESLIGKTKDVVRTRHGEPVETFASRKKDMEANIWVYGAVGVRFDKHPRVEKILDAKAVTRLLKTAK